MNGNYDLSIVVSSFNRDDKVLQSIIQLYESDFDGFEKIEVIVVDDGSPQPLENLFDDLKIPEKIDFRLITQKNSGIGATRNRGFREAKADIVLFLDDDILVKPTTVKEIYEAHRTSPGTIFFGNYPFISHETESLHRFARELYGYDAITDEPSFQEVNAITSGLLSVNKSELEDKENFYKNDLTVPAAEEYEIIARFYKSGIPIFRARHICAIHNHHLKLKWLVEQQYKYGLGTAEAFAKYSEVEDLKQFAELKEKMNALGKSDLKNLMKTAIASKTGRQILLFYAQQTEKLFRNSNRNRLFGLLASAYYWAGYCEGLKRFG